MGFFTKSIIRSRAIGDQAKFQTDRNKMRKSKRMASRSTSFGVNRIHAKNVHKFRKKYGRWSY